MPFLQLTDIAQSFDELKVLYGLELSIERGEHCLIYGPSGSGKTTLLNLIARLLEPDRGTLALEGRSYTDFGRADGFRLEHIGFVFQEFHLLEAMTVAQNIEIVQAASRKKGPALSLAELLEPLALASFSKTKVKRLSRGERQRVALARALANRPTLLLADEPTASLDPGNRSATIGHLFSMCAQTGATGIVVSHDEALLSHASFSHVLRLDGGTLRKDSPAP